MPSIPCGCCGALSACSRLPSGVCVLCGGNPPTPTLTPPRCVSPSCCCCCCCDDGGGCEYLISLGALRSCISTSALSRANSRSRSRMSRSCGCGCGCGCIPLGVWGVDDV